jgi:hypothetical protein
MSKVLPAKTPPALRASFSSLMLSSFLQPFPFVTLRPAIICSGLSSKEALNVTFRRSQLTEWHPASTIEQCLAAWVDSAIGKGKHGRGRGMSGSTHESQNDPGHEKDEMTMVVWIARN